MGYLRGEGLAHSGNGKVDGEKKNEASSALAFFFILLQINLTAKSE
jgi:hypothetical protein